MCDRCGDGLVCFTCKHRWRNHREQDRVQATPEEIAARRCRDCKVCDEMNRTDVLHAARKVVDGAPVPDLEPEAVPG